MSTASYDVVIVGGGQAGLALGYLLQQQRRTLLILDAAPTVGHSWRERWDSLTLFTPCPFTSLPGLAFPLPDGTFPTKDEVASYLERYAATFALPLALGQRVVALERAGRNFLIRTARAQFRAAQVVLATGPFQSPRVPAWHTQLPARVVQLHSSAYRNPRQLPSGPVLVVGAGNSGVQIARELAATHAVTLSVGRKYRSVPARVSGRLFFWRLYFGLFAHITGDSPLGRHFRQRDILFGNSLRSLRSNHGVRLVGRAVGAGEAGVRLVGGRQVVATTVIWATGFRAEYGWVKLPLCGADGQPRQHDGVTAVPGLYVLGLFWQRWSGSSLLGGVGQDARRLARRMARDAEREHYEAHL